MEAQISAALQNVTTLTRPGRVGYATFWDTNKYVQCRRMPDREWRCEAAGTLMQPSLRRVLRPEALGRLDSLGWRLDPSFGNYVRAFPADMPAPRIAKDILEALTQAYDARPDDLEVQTQWIADVPCPPRNGPSQNLAGSVNDSPKMRNTSVRACSYTSNAALAASPAAGSSEALISLYGPMATAEIQRLRINSTRQVYVVFDAGIGYIQCMPEGQRPAIYCEAQSAETWPALTAILTPDRVTRLRAAGYGEPGGVPNYWKSYPVGSVTDDAIANEVLTLLHEVYGYTGAAKLKVSTER